MLNIKKAIAITMTCAVAATACPVGAMAADGTTEDVQSTETVAATEEAAGVDTEAETAKKVVKAQAVAKTDISNYAVTVADQTYTGSALEPAVTVKTNAGATWTRGKDYRVEFYNNKDAGIADVVVIPLNESSYCGVAIRHFQINVVGSEIRIKGTLSISRACIVFYRS